MREGNVFRLISLFVRGGGSQINKCEQVHVVVVEGRGCDVVHTSIGKRPIGFQLKDFLVYLYLSNKMQKWRKLFRFIWTGVNNLFNAQLMQTSPMFGVLNYLISRLNGLVV